MHTIDRASERAREAGANAPLADPAEPSPIRQPVSRVHSGRSVAGESSTWASADPLRHTDTARGWRPSIDTTHPLSFTERMVAGFLLVVVLVAGGAQCGDVEQEPGDGTVEVGR